MRIWNLIHKCNASIDSVSLSITKTFIVDKKHVCIKIFSPDEVILHEIAHAVCKSIGHTDEFYYILNKLRTNYSNYSVY